MKINVNKAIKQALRNDDGALAGTLAMAWRESGRNHPQLMARVSSVMSDSNAAIAFDYLLATPESENV